MSRSVQPRGPSTSSGLARVTECDRPAPSAHARLEPPPAPHRRWSRPRRTRALGRLRGPCPSGYRDTGGHGRDEGRAARAAGARRPGAVAAARLHLHDVRPRGYADGRRAPDAGLPRRPGRLPLRQGWAAAVDPQPRDRPRHPRRPPPRHRHRPGVRPGRPGRGDLVNLEQPERPGGELPRAERDAQQLQRLGDPLGHLAVLRGDHRRRGRGFREAARLRVRGAGRRHRAGQAAPAKAMGRFEHEAPPSTRARGSST